MNTRAAVLHKTSSYPTVKDFELNSQEGEIAFPVLSSALNHRDLWICKGKYAGIKLPIILGSDGTVEFEGALYSVKPGVSWGNKQAYQSKDYQIRGLPGNGCFADHIYLKKEEISPIPDHLSVHEGAAFGLAGLTAYRALFKKAGIKEGDKIFINGIGGGVALMALVFALAHGNKVFVSSSQDWKLERAINMGAEKGFNYQDSQMDKKMKSEVGFMDIVIDSAGGHGFQKLVNICGKGARIVTYGGTHGMASFSPQKLFWNQISIFGTSMGSDEDWDQMWDFITRKQLKPVIDCILPLQDISHAFEKLNIGQQFGKIVLDHRL